MKNLKEIEKVHLVKTRIEMEKKRTYFWSIQCANYIQFGILGLLIAVQCITAQSSGFAPFIMPSEPDVTVLPSETVNFTCQSTEPIHWRFFEEFEGRYVVHESYNQNNDYSHQSILELPKVDVQYVGYYYCVKNLSDVENNNLETLVEHTYASKIYLFVEDPSNPLVPIDALPLNGNQYQDIVIPCKPTSKMWDIQLIKDGDERHEFEYKFDPTIGYRVKLKELIDSGTYTCHAKFDTNNDFDKHFPIYVDSGMKYVNKPQILSKTDDYGVEGGELELNCTVEAEYSAKLEIKWELPQSSSAKEEGRVEITAPVSEKHESNVALYKATGKLVVRNLDKSTDFGIYKCWVEDDSGNRNSDILKVQKILGPDESFIEIKEATNKYDMVLNETKREVKWHIKYAGHPMPTLVWLDPRGNEIPWSSTSDRNRKLEATMDKRTTTLKIRNPVIGDSGPYTLRANNGKMKKEQRFQLLVKEKPRTSVKGASVQPGQEATVECEIFGLPTSTIVWSFIPCEKIEFDTKSCDESKKIIFTNETVETIARNIFNQSSTLRFIPEATGIAICTAYNQKGSDSSRANVIINDLTEDLTIWSDNEQPISFGDDVSVICGASAHKYANELNWYKDDALIQSSNNIQVIPHNTPFSHRKEIRWSSIGSEAIGKYVCRANVIKDDSPDSKTWEMRIVEPKRPSVEESNIQNGKVLKNMLGEPLRLNCKFTGIPRPKITWYKDDTEILPETNDPRVVFHDNNTVLAIQYIKAGDDGRYKCVGANRIGSVTRETVLKITNIPTVSRALVLGVLALILLLVICTIYLCLRIRRERRLFRELKAAGLANFEEGNPESINPDLTLDEQADLLPYDKKYEFPRERLKLGKQLGAGAFGVVIKGVAQGILPYENETTVAVKMVKQMADNEVMRALISELKIMVHLGQHLNVVNLLGAVTKNIAQREVMVIVEYCRFGNLQNFLVKHRQYFIDQIDREKDVIDPSIQTRDARWSNDSGFSYLNRPDADRQSVVNSAYIRHTNPGDYFPGGMDSANTEATLLSRNSRKSGGEDNPALSNNSTQPAWRSNYQSDYKGPRRSVTTTDLLCWSFQVARGMQYLASRKVLHGDLAARNILLCDDNVVKICDFGLARSMYKSDNYRKKGEALLPFKWLALESISDQVFSTYSDVWSFGIVMWELFSLGKVPYPGMDADQALYFKLKDGYRMEKPDFATQDIYDIMLSCWCTNPESRPLFDTLEKTIGKQLESGLAEHYIDLNEPYLQSNVSNLNSGQMDYLALMGPPESMAPPTPNPPVPPTYVNSHVVSMPTTSTAQPDFASITMAPVNINSSMPDGIDTHDSRYSFAAINSPTIANNLNATNDSPKLRNKISKIPEEIPMLKRSNPSLQSDSDSELNTSDVLTSQTNATNTPRKNASLLNTVDNYVNVPSAKKDAVTNPGYIVVSNVNETRT